MVEAAFSIIKRTHELFGSHSGVKKIWSEMQRLYYGINREEVAWVIRHCMVCQANTSSNIRAPIQMIVSSNVNERWIIDLIDMRGRKFGIYSWVYHCNVC